jgi:N6-adenosine-specific RNA methylase IME4
VSVFPGFPHLGVYRTILADVPWQHENYGQAKHGAAKAAYPEMPLDLVCSMPVGALAHPDGALLWLWCTGAQAAEGAHTRVASAWGFRLVARPFAWVKCARACAGCEHGWHDHEAGAVSGAFVRGACARDGCACEAFAMAPAFGPGSYTGGGVEDVWLGVRGDTPWSARRARRDVRQVLVAPMSRRHSEKPEELQDRLEAIWPDGEPRLELFARRRRPSWACWGGECPDPDLVFGAEAGAWWRGNVGVDDHVLGPGPRPAMEVVRAP